ncbi:hypothetical protein PENTCL1PPCAC_29300, partial [Pristionchus entomophagus]
EMDPMDISESMRGQRFDDMRRALTNSMRTCKSSFDQYNRVMFTITELLYNGLECVKDRRPFKKSLAVEAAIDIIEACKMGNHPYEEVLLSFARAFVPFIDSLSGYYPYTRNEEDILARSAMSKGMTKQKTAESMQVKRPSATKTSSSVSSSIKRPGPPFSKAKVTDGIVATPNLAANHVQFKQVRVVPHHPLSKAVEPKQAISLPVKRARMSPPDPHQSPSVVPIKIHPRPVPSTAGSSDLLSEPLFVTSPQRSRRTIGGPSTSAESSDDWIKKEEEDYDEGVNVPPADGYEAIGAEMKEEIKDEVKEEPDEPPVHDFVRLGSNPGKAHVYKDGTPKPIRLAPKPRLIAKNAAPSQQPQESGIVGKVEVRKVLLKDAFSLCRLCGEQIRSEQKEAHFKLYHKDHWLDCVEKCPVKECDFRSKQKSEIKKHHVFVHGPKYRQLHKDRFLLPKSTRCPFCIQQITSLTQFVNHMEFYHKRLCTYEVPILKCGGCEHKTSRLHQMYVHWNERSPLCDNGLEFIYETAIRVENADLLRKRKEVCLEEPPHLFPQTNK